MRASLGEYWVVAPKSLDEALAIIADDPSFTPLAGGTDIMVLLAAGKLPPGQLVSIWGLDELRGIDVGPAHVTIGALTTYADIQRHATIRAEHPMLVQAARESGAAAIQNRGTIGGNIINASPAADTPPALLCYDAEVELVSKRDGSRWVPYAGFHTGYKQMTRRPDELLRAVRVPRSPGGAGALHVYEKVGTRAAQAISKVCFAGLGLFHDGRAEHLRLAFGSVAPTVVRAHAVEAIATAGPLDAARIADAVNALDNDIAPIDDIRSTREYRRTVSQGLARDFLHRLAGIPNPSF